MNRNEQLMAAYILFALLRLIASVLAGTHSFRTGGALDVFMQESDRIKQEEAKFWDITGVTK